ncbi:ROK family protein [Rhodospirillaceae bacterium KN72]|uniref:ROK family protein n=1 Tax=Pacificispira spongiicola TaxID=2729598 RepID=A0A7Y0DWU4_9PROT|nr:ROK family protein [Pacificispira spongiicola]NMM43079.1 ROK family protein [Pacificispira spongiicola]
MLDINPDAAAFIGLRLTSDRLDVFQGDARTILQGHTVFTVKTRQLSSNGIADFIEQSVRRFIDERSVDIRNLAGIGIAVQGIVDETVGCIRWSPILSCTPVDLGGALERRFGVPVMMDNDANTLGLAHSVEPQRSRNGCLVSIMIGYGVGMGIVIDGRVYRGNRGSAAEFGHMKISGSGALCRCGARGCIEASVGDYAIYRDAREILELSPSVTLPADGATMEEIAAEGRRGNAAICNLFRHAGSVLGLGVSNIVNLLAPEAVLITGAGTASFDLMKPGFDEALMPNILPSVRDITEITVMDWSLEIDGRGTIAMAVQHWIDERSAA